MAKMFYTLEEAAQRLSTTEQGIKDLVSGGDLTEYRDSGKNLVFKVDQVDRLLKKEDDAIKLADDSAIGLAPDDAGGSGAAGRIPAEGETTKERSGISIFDEADEVADPLAATQITAAQAGDATVEAMGSGSGLMEMTREGDDTSLGADLLAGVYEGEQAGGETAGTSGLFEPAGAASDVSAGAMVTGPVLIAVEPFDPVWSGIGGGLALGMLLVMGLALFVAMMAILNAGVGAFAGQLLGMGGLLGMVGILIGVLAIFAVIGFLLGRRG
jgi:hypothetical protein